MGKQKGRTEDEWLEASNPLELFAIIRGLSRSRRIPFPHRQCRLFACACCRLVWELLDDERTHRVVEVSELFADGQAKKSELGCAFRDAAEVAVGLKLPGEPHGLTAEGRHPPQLAAEMTVWAGSDSIHDVVEMTTLTAETLARALEQKPLPRGKGGSRVEPLRHLDRVFRDIFGNPFRPVTLDPTWLTSTVVSLAQTAYAERNLPSGDFDPDRLAVLADALEEAGAEGALLDHLRRPEPRVRGDHVVDRLLGRV